MAHRDHAHDDDTTLAVKVGTVVLTLAAGWVAQKAVTVIWKQVSGKAAPKDLDDPEVGIASAVAFAAVAASAGVLARRLASRNAKRVVHRFSSSRRSAAADPVAS